MVVVYVLLGVWVVVGLLVYWFLSFYIVLLYLPEEVLIVLAILVDGCWVYRLLLVVGRLVQTRVLYSCWSIS